MLWNTPLLDCMELGALMLERTGKAPLTVVWHPPSDKHARVIQPPTRKHAVPNTVSRHTPNFVDALKDRVMQISSLEVKTKDDEMRAICDLVFPPSKMLRKVHLVCRPVKDHQPALLIDYRKSGSSHTGIVTLEDLHMVNCFVQLAPVATQRIINLDIKMSSSKLPITMNDLLNLLHETPALKSLCLNAAIGAISADITNTNVPKLVRLSSIDIRDHPGRVSSFLSRLQASISSLQKFVVNAGSELSKDDVSVDTYMTDASKYLETTLDYANTKLTGYSRLTLDSYWQGSITISVGHGPSCLHMRTMDNECPTNDDPCETTLDFSTTEELDTTYIYSLVTRSGDWSSVRILEIEVPDYKIVYDGEYAAVGVPYDEPQDDLRRFTPTQSECSRLLESMPQLETLMLVGDTAGSLFLSALAGTEYNKDQQEDQAAGSEKRMRAAEGNRDSGVRRLNLELKTLHLHKMSLGLAAASHKHTANELIDHLEALLHSRHVHGLPILKLCATKAQLHGNYAVETLGGEEGEKNMWRAHFQQWVAHVELTTTWEDDEDGDED
jgi:hypothetical protein